jgi:hypothetical protein
MVARLCATGRSYAEGQASALAGTKVQTCGPDLEPALRRSFVADRSPRNVDDDPLSTIVPQLDPSRARCGECELCG